MMQNQKGFGLLEVMVSIVVLGLMIVALNKMQVGNRWQLTYNKARSSAMLKAQRIIDSLQVGGINAIDSGIYTKSCNDGDWNQTGQVQKKSFTCIIDVDNLGEKDGYVYSKQVNVTVQWDINNHTHRLVLPGVIE